MTRPAVLACALLVAVVSPSGAQDAGPATAVNATQALVNQYCVGCHNERLKRGELVLSGLDAARPAANAATWEKVARKVRAGMMPPVGAKRPDPSRLAALAGDLEASLDRAAEIAPNPGRPALHRLNRVEYRNSVRDLLGFEVDAVSLLPPDDMSHGFDNVADSLTLSPTLLDGYIAAANVITRLATGDPNVSPRVATYRVPQTVTQNEHVEGTPLGTRGGVAVRHYFPADGEYSFGMSFYHYNGKMFGALQDREQIEVSVDGARVALLDINLRQGATDEVRTPPIKIKAGARMVAAAFIRRAAGPVQDFIQPFENALSNLAAEVPGVSGLLHVLNLGITGPTNVTGLGDTPSRRRIFSCRPTAPRDEEACATTILSTLARQAFRRPVTAADSTRLMRLYREGRSARGDFEAGIRIGLQGILADPEFLFRFERTPAGAAPGSTHRISDLELASRLSYFLWSSSPDDALIQLASKGRLKDPVVLEQQVQRMLADRRADALAENFASQWLHLRNLRDWHPDPFVFPDADRNLMRSMERETELLFMSVVREDRPILDLLTADYSFVDGRLARHYGISNVVGNRFRKVPVTDEARRGLLGHASILTVTALPTRTSPVVRGKWILDNLLGAPPPQPPPDVPPLPENTDETKPVPLRARLQAHRASPTCAACHAVMDPIGFALEGFDAVGRAREFDSGERITPSGELMDGTVLDGPLGLRKALLDRSELFARTFTEKLLTYALGRGLDHHDMPVARSIVKRAGQRGQRFSAFVLAVVNSSPFQMRTTEPAAPTDAGNGR